MNFVVNSAKITIHTIEILPHSCAYSYWLLTFEYTQAPLAHTARVHSNQFSITAPMSTIFGSYIYLEEEKKVRDHFQVKMEFYGEA